MNDFEAIGRLKRGDISGLELLVARHQLKAIRTAFLITHDERLAEDVVQDVFLRFFHHARRFDPSRPFAPYFLRCVVNAALDATQKECRDVPADGWLASNAPKAELSLNHKSPENGIAFRIVSGFCGQCNQKVRGISFFTQPS